MALAILTRRFPVCRLAATVFVYFACALNGAADEPIRIGVLTDLSGDASYYGNQTRVGAMLAEKELLAQGKNLKVIFEDSALSTSRGVSAAQKLLFVDKVDAIYVDFTAIAVAVSPLVRNRGRVLLYSAAAESVARNNPLAFKTYSDYALGCEALVREFLKKGMRRIGVLKTETEYGELCLKGAKRARGVLEQPYKQGESVASQMLVFKNKGVEAVINASFEIDSRNTLQAARNLNYEVKLGFAEDNYSHEFEKKFKDVLEGSLSFGLKRLPEAVIDRANSIPGADKLVGYESVGLGYVHLKQLVAAVEGCRAKSADCITKALAGAGPDPDIGFEGWKDRVARLRTIVKEYSGGKLQEIGSYVSN